MSLSGQSGAAAFQAASDGDSLAFGSATSFGDAEGAAPLSQYLAARTADGWAAHNVTPPLLSGTYEGGAYLLFSGDLSRGLLGSGWSCRAGASECNGENPPLTAGAPSGYRNAYLREDGVYEPLITLANAPALSVDAENFHLSVAGASADAAQVVLSSCAALVGEALEVPAGEGCDATAQNLYLFGSGDLEAINLLPSASQTAPGAVLAAPRGAISTDGTRVYWQGADGNLYLREGGQTIQADVDAGGEGTFQTASASGAIAYFTKAGHLYRFTAADEAAVDLSPDGEVLGVLGASDDGARVYYLSASGLFLWHSGTTTKVATTADASNYPPGTGTAHLTPDGARLAFLSNSSLTGYPNVGKVEVFTYDAVAKKIHCASCNPSGKTPFGSSAIPAARSAGEGAPPLYKPRALSADGSRLFFDSLDALLSVDTDKAMDVYEWVAQGIDGCAKANGCVGLISNGRLGAEGFLDASSDGADIFFTSNLSLVPSDTGGLDVYDARRGGGFPEAAKPLPCVGDDCQGPPVAPDDPVPGTGTLQGPPNPPVHFAKQKKKKKQHRQKRRKGSRRDQGKPRGGQR